MSDPIVIVEYDPEWQSEFARLRDRAQAALGELALSVEHLGSTAVTGLAAKPVIDLVVVIESDDDLPEETGDIAPPDADEDVPADEEEEAESSDED